MHLREDAEAIAFCRSEAQERARIESDFDEVFRNFARLFRKQRAPNLLQRGFSHLSLALPAVIRADVALSGELKVGCPVQAAGALTAILGRSAYRRQVRERESVRGRHRAPASKERRRVLYGGSA